MFAVLDICGAVKKEQELIVTNSKNMPPVSLSFSVIMDKQTRGLTDP
jgi:hypothetical protein